MGLRSAVTVTLMVVWVLLMAFAVISMINPPWLQVLSSRGQEVEFRNYKHYGDDAMREGRFRLAVPQYERALEIQPDEPGALLNLGVAWMQLGNEISGERYLRRALEAAELDRTRGLACEHLSGLAAERGDTTAAIALMERSIGYGAENLGPRLLQKGQLLMNSGRPVEAEAAFREALRAELDPGRSYRAMLQRRREMLEEGDPEWTVLDEQAALSLEDPFFERYDLDLMRRAQERDRRVAVVLNHLGWSLIQQERYPEAIPLFQRSLLIWPDNANASRNLLVLERMERDRLRSEMEASGK